MRDYTRIRLLKTLVQAVPICERPRCGNCNKTLVPETEMRIIGEEDATPPDNGTLPRWRLHTGLSDPLPYTIVLGVYRETRSVSSLRGCDFYAHVLLGTFKGYSCYRDTGPLFCKMECGAKFGCANFVAGHRRKFN